MRRNVLLLSAIVMIFLITLAIFLLPLGSSELRQESPLDPQRIEQNMQGQLDLGPRIPGTQASLDFGTWVNETVPSGWQVEVQSWVHLGVTLRNYWITSGENSFPEYVVGAHYDSREYADRDPQNPDQPVPGANDGASGIAGQIEIMHELPEKYHSNIGFVMFDGEDQGSINGWSYIVGSEYFVDQLSQNDIESMSSFLLLDMIGDDDLTMYQEGLSTDSLVNEIWSLADELGYSDSFIDEVGYSLIDDHRPFLDVGIPAVDLIDFEYPEWHTTEDDMSNVSPESVAIVTDVAYVWLVGKLDTLVNDETTLTSVSTSVLGSSTTEAPLYFIPTLILLPLSRRRVNLSM